MVILLVLLSLLAVAPAAAQIDDQPVVAVSTPGPEPTPIPISEIPTRAASTLETMRDLGSGISSDERLTQIRQALPAEQERVAELSRQTDERLQAPGRASAIKEAEKSALRIRDRFERWMGDLTTRSSQLEDLRGYVAERGAPLLVWVLLWAGFAASLILMRRRAKVWVQHDPSLQTEVDILGRPITGAAIIVLVLSYIVEAQAPTAWIDVVNLLLLLTLLLLLLGVMAKGLRATAYLLIPLFVLLRAVELFPVASISHRLVLLALAATGIGCCAWFLRAVRGVPGLLPDARMRWVGRGVRLAILLLAVGLLANLTGAVR